MNQFTVKPLIFVLAIAFSLIGIELQSADAQWVRKCENGVCRWVPARAAQTVQTVLPPYPAAQQFREYRQAPLLIDVVQSQIVQDIPVQVISPVDDLQSKAVESLAIGDRQFIRTVRDATTKARQAGKISALQQARVLAAVRLPNVGKEVEQLIAAEMKVPVSATGLIDWENFDPEKFLVLIEGILKILLVFGIGV